MWGYSTKMSNSFPATNITGVDNIDPSHIKVITLISNEGNEGSD